MISPETKLFTPRSNAAVAALNETEIVIFGGQSAESHLKDIVIFDCRLKQCRVVENAGSHEFVAFGNQSVNVEANKVISLVRSKDNLPLLLQYTKGKKSL